MKRETWFICPNCGSERFGSSNSAGRDDYDILHCSGESIRIVLAEPGRGLTVDIQRCGFVGPRPTVFLREPAPRSAELANYLYHKIFRIPSRPINPKLIAEIIREFEEHNQ